MGELLDFKQAQKAKFQQLAFKIQENPELYLDFEHVADFYQAVWLADFPHGTTWYATGLDDGAEAFYAKIEYSSYFLTLSCGIMPSATFGISEEKF